LKFFSPNVPWFRPGESVSACSGSAVRGSSSAGIAESSNAMAQARDTIPGGHAVRQCRAGRRRGDLARENAERPTALALVAEGADQGAQGGRRENGAEGALKGQGG
jgi:hypothetical protein